MVQGKEIKVANASLDCYQVDEFDNYLHPNPAMCQETERLTRTFLALAKKWSATFNGNEEVYGGDIQMHGTLPSSKKARDFSKMSAQNRREWFAANELQYTENESNVYYIDEDQALPPEIEDEGLPDSAYGGTHQKV